MYSNIPSPCFVLEEKKLIQNLELLKKVQEKAGVSIILALKGYALYPTFPLIKKYLQGATASSLNEARLIKEEMGCLAHTYSPAYLPHELDELLKWSSHLTFNSISQLKKYRENFEKVKKSISVGMRVNPEWSDVETDLYNPCAPGSRLGELSTAFQEGLPEGVEGLHFHALCESNADGLEQVLLAFEGRFGHLFSQLKWVNLGGGHLMTRNDYDVEKAIQILKSFREKYGFQVILEPGSAIGWQTGFLKSTVLDIVENKGIRTAILDVSFTCHMPDTLEMPYRPKVRGATDAHPDQPSYRLGGVSCLAGDFMEAYSFERPLSIGDTVILEDMLHYTLVKTTMFNGVPHPSIGMIKADGEFELIRSFGYEDYRSRMG